MAVETTRPGAPCGIPLLSGESLGVLLLSGLLTFAIYSQNFPAAFASDDYTHLGVYSPGEILGFWFHLRIHPELINGEYRPWTDAVFAIERHLFGDWPAPYRVVNALMHATSGWLVYLLLRGFSLPGMAALGGALFWIVHPSLVHTTARVSVQADPWVTIFCAAALVTLQRARELRWALLGFAGWFAMGLFSKENALSLPFIATMLLWLPGMELRNRWPARSRTALTAVAWGIFVFYWVYRLTALGRFGGYGVGQHLRVDPFLVTALVQYWAWFLGFTNAKLEVYQLAADYGPILVTGLVAAIGLAPSRYKGGILWVLLALVPVYTILKITNAFWPLVGMAWLFGVAVQDLERSSKLIGRRAAGLLLVVAPGLLFQGTVVTLGEFREASGIAHSFRTQLEAAFPDPEDGTVFYFSDLPNNHKDVFVLGIGLYDLVQLAFPDARVTGRQGYRESFLTTFQRDDGRQAVFFDWQDGKLVRQPERESWFREVYLPNGPAPPLGGLVEEPLVRIQRRESGLVAEAAPGAPGSVSNVRLDVPEEVAVSFQVAVPEPSAVRELTVTLAHPESLNYFTHTEVEWLTADWQPLGRAHLKLHLNKSMVTGSLPLHDFLDWRLAESVGAMRVRMLSMPGTVRSATIGWKAKPRKKFFSPQLSP